ncbi:IS5/IS1182 family transposase, partial [Halorubrum sp. AD140]|nr:IS5/IS1182 family transposase [Halorubrum sp. AD140]
MSNTSATLQNVASVDDFLNAAATGTVPLFEYLEF